MTVTTPARTQVPFRGITSLVALGVPAVVTAVTTAVALSWKDRLPDPVASHWGPDGINGTSSLLGLLLPLSGMTLAFAAMLWAIGFFWGHAAMTRRFAVAASVWISIFVNGLVVVMLVAQLDAPTAAAADELGGWLPVVIVGALALGALAAWLVPGDHRRPATGQVPDDAARLPLPESERASWVRHMRAGNPVWIGAAVIAFAAVMGVTTGSPWFGLMFAVLLLPMLAVTDWTVSVDRRGLVARSMLPRPRLIVPVEEVEEAAVVQVHPIREFGGWGLRSGLSGRVGLVLRKGEGIEVLQTGGRRVVVTVDDAETGAALLNTLAARTRA